jgi:hypothetical protein
MNFLKEHHGESTGKEKEKRRSVVFLFIAKSILVYKLQVSGSLIFFGSFRIVGILP